MPLDLSHVAKDLTISDEEIIVGFATLMAAMKYRGIIRTKNVVGDLGERYAEMIYKTHSPKGPLTRLDTNRSDVDAKDASGSLYSVKAASPESTRTSALHLESDHDSAHKVFDFLVVVRVDHLLQPTAVFEFTWEIFWQFKQWSKRQKAWFMPLSKTALNAGSRIYASS